MEEKKYVPEYKCQTKRCLNTAILGPCNILWTLICCIFETKIIFPKRCLAFDNKSIYHMCDSPGHVTLMVGW